MRETIEKLLPGEIEARSFEIIARELGERTFPPEQEPVIRRVIHTTADFDYADNLVFSDGAVEAAHAALKRGASIVTDTNMARAGINKTALGKLGGQVFCFMADEDVAARAKALGETRAAVSVDKAAELSGELIFAVGNAPTALIRLHERIREGVLKPSLVIGVPVGFVNVIPAKELIMELEDVPYIVARGRKGGSNVAAAIVNALIYGITDR